MMQLKCSGLVRLALALCVSCFSCDDDAEVVRDPDSISASGQPEPGTATGGSGGASGTAPGDPAGAACMPTACPAVTALGGVVPGCCQNDGTCGALVLVMGRPLCAPPNVDNLVAGASRPLMQLNEEAVQSDPGCEDRQIFGTRLPGCCDQSGVCGVSTAPVASGSPGAIPGLALPVTCVSPEEAAQLGGGMAALGSELPQACGEISASPDAGATPPAAEPSPGQPPPAEPPLTPAVASDAGAPDAGD